MPELLRLFGLRFLFFSNDHNPLHVHEGQGKITAKAMKRNWNHLNEDLAFDNFFQEKHDNPLYRLFLAHPEINVSAVARRLGISQSLMAQYIGGGKKPSPERANAIVEVLREIGTELSLASL